MTCGLKQKFTLEELEADIQLNEHSEHFCMNCKKFERGDCYGECAVDGKCLWESTKEVINGNLR